MEEIRLIIFRQTFRKLQFLALYTPKKVRVTKTSHSTLLQELLEIKRLVLHLL